jgi:hypothetical protein
VQDSLHTKGNHFDKFFVGAKQNYRIWKLWNNIQEIKILSSFTNCIQGWIIKTLGSIVAPQSSNFFF